ncbi:hypothetical protein B5S33_g174 [[Candida] boidinii]|nr:hypothetical protein B5S30_g3874 [[Candida] boidinii]OWB81555.1 hypothetical protein B5S33_g174 [[Candida] boidinii]
MLFKRNNKNRINQQQPPSPSQSQHFKKTANADISCLNINSVNKNNLNNINKPLTRAIINNQILVLSSSNKSSPNSYNNSSTSNTSSNTSSNTPSHYYSYNLTHYKIKFNSSNKNSIKNLYQRDKMLLSINNTLNGGTNNNNTAATTNNTVQDSKRSFSTTTATTAPSKPTTTSAAPKIAAPTGYYYRFPRIPRPKRNVLYYTATITTSVLTSHFSTLTNRNRNRNGPVSASSNPASQDTTTTGKRGHGFFFNRRYFSSRSSASSPNPSQQQQQKSKNSSRFRKNYGKWFALTSISIIFYGVVSKINHQEVENQEVIRPTSWHLYAYSTLPLKTISRIWGQFNSMTLPIWLRSPGYKLYSYMFGVNLEEMQDPDLTHYNNLGEFFYRKIKPEARPIDETCDLICPCDGRVLKLGIVNEDGEIEQVKGMTYSIDALLGTHEASIHKKLAVPTFEIDYSDDLNEKDLEFLKLHKNSKDIDPQISKVKENKLISFEDEGDVSLKKSPISRIIKISNELLPDNKDNNNNSTVEKPQQQFSPNHTTISSSNSNTKLFYAVIYLAPGDYHRFHSPTNWVSCLRRHFVGELFSVAPYFQRTFQNLFVLNERVALLGYWKHGFFSMTPVGATNVGSIKINFDKDLTTNKIYENSKYSSNSATTSTINNTNADTQDSDSDDLTLVDTATTDDAESTITTNSQRTISEKRKKVIKNTCYEATYSKASKLLNGQPLFKGEEIGGFELGSTIVLVFEAPKNFEFSLKENQAIKLGQKIGDLKN